MQCLCIGKAPGCQENWLMWGGKRSIKAHNLICMREQVFWFYLKVSTVYKQCFVSRWGPFKRHNCWIYLFILPRISQLLKSLGERSRVSVSSSASQQTDGNAGFSHVWLWDIIVHNSIEKIDTGRVMRFTVTANVEFVGSAFGMPVASHSSLSRQWSDAEPRRILLPSKSKRTETRLGL